jgi:tetratricopeptide (TPR) repeat protein
VTNKHVIYGAVTYRVRKGEKAWPASLVRLDQAHDLCALKPEAGWTANPTPVRASSDVEVGERVYAIGAPEGLELTLSEGLVSALRHVDNRPIIQTSAPVSHGSSGGGLFDSQGRLIGVTAFSVKGGQNLNFALPTEWVLGLGGESAARFPPSASGSQLEEAKKWSDKGFRAYLDEKYQEAIDYYKEAVRLNPDDHRSWQYLGKAELQLRRYADALEALRQATRLEGEDAQDWVALSWAYIALGRYEDAVDAANSAWLLDNENAGSWALLTGVYLRAGKCDEALENSEVTLVLFPGDKWAEAVAEKVQARCGSR